MDITRDDIIIAIQEMQQTSVIVNKKEWMSAAEVIEQSFDALLAENKLMLERLQRIEAIRFQNG